MSDVRSVPGDRGARGRSWFLLTPANRYASRLPGLRGGVVFKLLSPRMAPSRLGQALVALEPGGQLAGPTRSGFEHFFYVLRGSVSLEGRVLEAGAFAYHPTLNGLTLTEATGTEGAEALWLKRVYESWPGVTGPPAAVDGHIDDAGFEATPVPGLTRRELIDPLDPAFDFNVSLLRFAAGGNLGKIEIHDEEHGLYMVRGGGAYELDGTVHEVRADDFIYMAPYCPQGFVNTGGEEAEYLLYKDVYRDGF